MSNDVVIKVEGLGKKYTLSHQAERQRYTALRDVIAEKANSLFRRAKFAHGAEDGRSQMEGGVSANSKLLTPISSPSATISNLQSSGEAISQLPSSAEGPAPSPISQLQSTRTSTSEDFWALRDVSFEVRQGEVVGIIGLPREIDFHQPTHGIGKCTRRVLRAGHAEPPFHRGTNGAGKSTLLKILSSPSRSAQRAGGRITEPTEGRAKGKCHGFYLDPIPSPH